ncbi:MAG: hypothetical protein J1E61_02345 [Lachnospiraceae bacterium]|nr:hypothetical protein [Lachnospiraceae bacterium]
MNKYQPENSNAYSPDPVEIRTDLPLGSIDYDYMQAKKLIMHDPKPLPTFKQQLWYSFLPNKYGNYTILSIPQARRFVKDLSPYMIFLYLLTFIAFLFINPDMNLWLKNAVAPIIEPFIAIEWILKIFTALSFGLAVLILLWPIHHRFWSMIVRQIGKLYLKIVRKKVSPKNLYIISIYTFVPFRILLCIPFLIPNTVAAFIAAGIIKSLDVIVTITYMCIATSYVD